MYYSCLWVDMLDILALGICGGSSSYNVPEFPWNFWLPKALEISLALFIAEIVVYRVWVTV